jgi:hypothetical protein
MLGANQHTESPPQLIPQTGQLIRSAITDSGKGNEETSWEEKMRDAAQKIKESRGVASSPPSLACLAYSWARHLRLGGPMRVHRMHLLRAGPASMLWPIIFVGLQSKTLWMCPRISFSLS